MRKDGARPVSQPPRKRHSLGSCPICILIGVSFEVAVGVSFKVAVGLRFQGKVLFTRFEICVLFMTRLLQELRK